MLPELWPVLFEIYTEYKATASVQSADPLAYLSPIHATANLSSRSVCVVNYLCCRPFSFSSILLMRSNYYNRSEHYLAPSS